MAGFLALAKSDTYIGTYKATEEIENGSFVVFDHVEKTGKLASAGDTDVYFVVNEIDTALEQGIDDIDFKVKAGEFLRAHRPDAGEILVTTVIPDGLDEGDELVIADGGSVEKAVEKEGMFVVKELTNEYGAPTARLLVL